MGAEYALIDNPTMTAAYVRELQASGVRELVICLRSANTWGSKQAGKLRSTNLTPKPQFLVAYEKWISAVVERYDDDGKSDMPGLRHPVTMYEIGSEFSSYEPEPVPEYLAMLEKACRAAHAAFDGVRIAEHSLADIRKILDRPDIFDLVNLHSLGDPGEIEDLTAWLEWEMGRRNYRKPIIISDTATSPCIAWGPAVVCNKPPAQMGLVVPPAIEGDRCRAAEYFTRLVAGDPATVRWTRGFTAADNVNRRPAPLQAQAAGRGNRHVGVVRLHRSCQRERRAGYHALRQLMTHLKDYDDIIRLTMPDPALRIYEIRGGTSPTWIAWVDAGRLALPGDAALSRETSISTGGREATIEPLITRFGMERPEQRVVPAPGGKVTVMLTEEPVFVVVRR